MDFYQAIKTLEIDLEYAKKLKLEEIKEHAKKKYRALCLVHHPDKGGDEKNFKEINRAFTCINELQNIPSNQTAKMHVNINPTSFMPQFMNFNIHGHGHGHIDINNIFSQAFTRMPNVQWKQSVTLNVKTTELYKGCSKVLNIKRNKFDPLTRQQTITNQVSEVKIPAGSFNDYRINLDSLTIIINEINDTKFRRDKQNLYYDATVTLRDALLGGTLEIQHPSGETLKINYRLQNPYDIQTIKCKGMPLLGTNNSFGDLIIKFTVLFPREIPEHLVIDLDGTLGALDYQI